jgi:uncharacterized membrane protein YphA (DoxX/SURF4 family)
MSKKEKKVLFVIRNILAWIFIFAGANQLTNPAWSAAPYLLDAKSFSFFYEFLAQDSLIQAVNIINNILLILIGISLVTGKQMKIATTAGMILMALYFFLFFDFPYTKHGYLVDHHIIYILILWLLRSSRKTSHYSIVSLLKK